MGSFSWNKADNLTQIENIRIGTTFKFLIPKEFGGRATLGEIPKLKKSNPLAEFMNGNEMISDNEVRLNALVEVLRQRELEKANEMDVLAEILVKKLNK